MKNNNRQRPPSKIRWNPVTCTTGPHPSPNTSRVNKHSRINDIIYRWLDTYDVFVHTVSTSVSSIMIIKKKKTLILYFYT